MKKFKEWTETFNQNIDGPPLTPDTIMGAENQLKALARNIRTTFLLDPRFKNNPGILEATNLIDKAADVIGNDVDGSLRQTKYQISQ